MHFKVLETKDVIVIFVRSGLNVRIIINSDDLNSQSNREDTVVDHNIVLIIINVVIELSCVMDIGVTRFAVHNLS